MRIQTLFGIPTIAVLFIPQYLAIAMIKPCCPVFKPTFAFNIKTAAFAQSNVASYEHRALKATPKEPAFHVIIGRIHSC